MKHGSTWWTRPLPHYRTCCASVTTLHWTSTNDNWHTLCCIQQPHTQMTSQRDEPMMILSRSSPQKVSDELAVDAWSWTNKHEEAAARQKHDKLVKNLKNNQNVRTELDNGRAFGDTCHSHCEQTPHKNKPKMISSRHSATKECEMNSSLTSAVAQHTDQQTSQTNQKHQPKRWHWDVASDKNFCENNLHRKNLSIVNINGFKL